MALSVFCCINALQVDLVEALLEDPSARVRPVSQQAPPQTASSRSA